MTKKSIWQKENTSGMSIDRPWKWVLLPGIVIQWFLYMFPSGGFQGVVSDTRSARSHLMTYYFSAVFYVGMLFFFFMIGSR